MKKLLCLSALVTLQALAEVVPAPVDHLFVPKGFDNNDNVEVIVAGKFPNPCFTRNKVEVKVTDDLIDVSITSLKREDVPCDNLKVPYRETVTIGSLQSGDYKVRINGKLEDKLQVAQSTSSSVDENLYASVDYVELGFTGGLAGDAMIVAHTVSSCLEFDRVDYLSNGKDTYSIMPILKRKPGACAERRDYIEIPVKFDVNAMKNDSILLFVRSMDGKSAHALVERSAP